MVSAPRITLEATRQRCCVVCGRVLPDRTGKPGRPLFYCAPEAGQEASTCARLDKRMTEIRRLAGAILDDIINQEGAATQEARRRFQVVKGYTWRELNVATNRGKLVKAGV